MPSFSSLTIPALYVQTSRQFAPRSMAAIRQAQFSSRASNPKSEIVTFEEIDTLVRNKDKVKESSQSY